MILYIMNIFSDKFLPSAWKMYEMDEDYNDEGEEAEEISNEIWQEACWIVISAYFDEKGRASPIDFEFA